jgi:regulator of replication initiation timing
MIKFLQEESNKLRMKNHLVTTESDEVKAAQAHLSKQYVGLYDSHEAVKQYASEMSQANMALNLKNMELKKKYSEAKKTMKKLNGEHKSKIQKFKDLMIAKDKDHSSEIKCLQAKVKTQNSSRAAFLSTSGAAFHSSETKQKFNKRYKRYPNSNSKPPRRAKLHGRASPDFYRDSSVSSIADEERWDNDGFYEIDSDVSPFKAIPSGYAGNKSKNMNSPSALPNTSLGKRVVSPEYGIKKVDSQTPPSALQREGSSSSLRDALNRSESGSNPNSRRSSLAVAAAASKPSRHS